MSEEDIEEITQLISICLSKENFPSQDRGEADQRLTSLSIHVANLPILFEFLKNCRLEHLFMAFKMIDLFYTKRGCLLSANALCEQIDFLIEFCCKNIQAIATKVILPKASKVIALAYRYLFELYCLADSRISTYPALLEIFNQPGLTQTLALHIMKSIVDCIKTPFNHKTEKQQQDLKSFFQNNQLHVYFGYGIQILQIPQNTNVLTALDLILSCLKFSLRTENCDIDTYCFTAPKSMIQNYQSTEIPQLLFQIFNKHRNDVEISTSVIEALLFFSSATDTTWKTVADSRFAFLEYVAQQLTIIMKSDLQDLKIINSISRFIFKLGSVMPLIAFLTHENISEPFFEAAQNFSANVFSMYGKTEPYPIPVTCLKFWAKVGKTASSAYSANLEQFLQIFPSVFQIYVDSCLSSFLAMKNADECYPNTLSSFVDDHTALWDVALIDPVNCAQYISNLLSQKTQAILSGPGDREEVKIVLYQISALILMVTSRLSIRNNGTMLNADIITAVSTLIDSVFSFINETNPALGDLCNLYGEEFVVCENALHLFAVTFKRDYFSQKNMFYDRIYENMTVANTRKDAFDLIINRFLNDIQTFRQDTDLLLKLLQFIEDASSTSRSPTLQEYATSNNLLSLLITRQIFLDFDGIETSKLKKLLSFLNIIYTHTIKSVEAWNIFLSYFDARFRDIASANYENCYEINKLYREVNGVFKGVSSHIDFLMIFKWFLENHLEDTKKCIAKYSQDLETVYTVCQTWYQVCSNKQKLIIPSGSSLGLYLFHASLSVINVLAETVPDSPVKLLCIMKIIQPSLGSKYTNFGIMAYFNDSSMINMVDIFFSLLFIWDEEDVRNSCKFKGINYILGTMLIIAENCKEELFKEDNRFQIVCTFIKKALLGTIDADKESMEAWKSCCMILTLMMETIIENDLKNHWQCFEPIFIVLFDGLINISTAISDSAAKPLYYFTIYGREFVLNVINIYCGLFNEDFLPIVQGIMERAFLEPHADVAKFRNALVTFRRDIRRFATRMTDIPEYLALVISP